MSTNTYDWTTVTSPSEALDWFNNSIRKAAEYNVFGNKTVFEAIVLADAYPLSVNAAGSPAYPAPAAGDTGPTWGVNTRFAFKARIAGTPSPHAFLPDPCDPQYETQSSFLNTSIIDSHTTFISQVGYSTDPAKRPKTGDIVEVRLRPGPNGYDLQYGNFIKVLDSYRVGAEENTRPQCTSMETLFRVSPNSAALLRTEPTPHFDSIIPDDTIAQYPTSGRVTSGFTYLRIDPLKPENGGRPHPGQDIAAAEGTPVYPALGSGKVISMNTGCTAPPDGASDAQINTARACGSGFGNWVRIEHTLPGQLFLGNKIYTSYNHLLSINVTVGQDVELTTKIGEVGHTGYSTGAHLHWEVSTTSNFARPTLPNANPKIRRGDPDRMKQVDPAQGLGLSRDSSAVSPNT